MLLDVLINLKVASDKFPLWIVIGHRALIFLLPIAACVHNARETPDEEMISIIRSQSRTELQCWSEQYIVPIYK